MSATYTSFFFTAANLELLDRFWPRLWRRGYEEFARLGITAHDARALVDKFARAGEAGVLCADGEPVAIMGLTQSGDEVATWFQATDDFDEHVFDITRWIIDELDQRQREITIYSVCVHPRTERWFRILGFKRDGWEGRTRAGWPLIRFKRSEHVHVE